MEFRRWVENNRVEKLLHRLIDCRVNVIGLSYDISLISESNVKELPKSLMANLRKRFLTVAKDSWHDELNNPTSPVNWASRGVKWVTSNKKEPNSSTSDDQTRVQKAKEAIATLSDILKDPKFEPILSHLEQEVDMMDKPAGEQGWHDELGNSDHEMSQGNDDHMIGGYMNPQWEKELQGEALTPGGKMFREWLKRRVNEDLGSTNTGSPVMGTNVASPTDPKVIAQRKAVNDMTSTMMKKNPRLKPGATDQQTVANMATSDPQLAKADSKVQQDVSKFFLKPEK